MEWTIRGEADGHAAPLHDNARSLEVAHRDALRIRTKLAGIEGAHVAILATEDGAEVAAWTWSRAEGDAGWKSTAGGLQ